MGKKLCGLLPVRRPKHKRDTSEHEDPLPPNLRFRTTRPEVIGTGKTTVSPSSPNLRRNYTPWIPDGAVDRTERILGEQVWPDRSSSAHSGRGNGFGQALAWIVEKCSKAWTHREVVNHKDWVKTWSPGNLTFQVGQPVGVLVLTHSHMSLLASAGPIVQAHLGTELELFSAVLWLECHIQ